MTNIRDILHFYAEAGVDQALEEQPVDRFAESADAVSARSPAKERHQLTRPEPARVDPRAAVSPSQPAISGLAVPDETQAARAREMARQASSLSELREIVDAFDGCNLKLTAKQTVFCDGNPSADLMLVGEAPGRDEDIEGLPFVGRSGRLLDRMLAAIGIDRQTAYIANVIPWRPPGNRTPTPIETEICRPFVERQIELANPKVLVTLGGPSAKVLLHANEGVLRLRGTWKTHRTTSGIEIPAMPTLHPAYLLRNPAHKKLAWRDFLEIKAKLSTPRG